MDKPILELTPEQQKLADEILAGMEKQSQQLSKDVEIQEEDENIAEFSMYLAPELTEFYAELQEACYEYPTLAENPEDLLNKIADQLCKYREEIAIPTTEMAEEVSIEIAKEVSRFLAALVGESLPLVFQRKY